MSCPFRFKQQVIDIPSGNPSTWIPSNVYEDVCELRFSGDMVFGWKKCLGEDVCPVMKG